MFQSISAAVEYLKIAQAGQFEGVTPEECVSLLKLKNRKGQDAAAKGFEEFKLLYKNLKDSKLLLRNAKALSTDLKNRGVKNGERFEQVEARIEEIANALTEKQKKLLLLAEKIRWLHGTNSASLPVLKRTALTFRPTGVLLDSGVAPMCGELKKNEGIRAFGISQNSISVCTVDLADKCWGYAAGISHSFSPKKFEENPRQFFLERLASLESYLLSEDGDGVLIELLQMKQWMPAVFQELCDEFQGKIDALLESAGKAHLSERERQAIQLIDLENDLLLSAKANPDAFRQLLNMFPQLSEEELHLALRDKLVDESSYLKGASKVLRDFDLFPRLLAKIVSFKVFGLTPRSPLSQLTGEMTEELIRHIQQVEISQVSQRHLAEALAILSNPLKRDEALQRIGQKITTLKEKSAGKGERAELIAAKIIQILTALTMPRQEIFEGVTNPFKRQDFLDKFPGLHPDDLEESLCKPHDVMDPNYLISNRDCRFEDCLTHILQVRLYHEKRLIDHYFDQSKERIEELLGSPFTVDHFLKKYFKDPIQAKAESNKRFFERKRSRLARLFMNENQVGFSQEEQRAIQFPHPIVLASTSSPCLDRSRIPTEKQLEKAQLGKEIDLLFVPKDQMSAVREWLLSQGLDKSVKVINSDAIQNIADLPLGLIPGKDAVLLDSMLYSEESLKNVFSLSKKIALPYYQRPFPGGGNRAVHGPLHASRVMLWTMLFAEIYRENNRHLNVSPVSLALAAGLHDAAREGDGVDLWDEASGQIVKMTLSDLGDKDAEFLGECVAKKDDGTGLSLEKEIIHDADCIDILRLFLLDSSSFEMGRLFLGRSLDPDIAFNLVKEAKEFIRLTESEDIKIRIELSANPLEAIFQFMEEQGEKLGKFAMMRRYLSASFKAFQNKASLSSKPPSSEL